MQILDRGSRQIVVDYWLIMRDETVYLSVSLPVGNAPLNLNAAEIPVSNMFLVPPLRVWLRAHRYDSLHLNSVPSS